MGDVFDLLLGSPHASLALDVALSFCRNVCAALKSVFANLDGRSAVFVFSAMLLRWLDRREGLCGTGRGHGLEDAHGSSFCTESARGVAANIHRVQRQCTPLYTLQDLSGHWLNGYIAAQLTLFSYFPATRPHRSIQCGRRSPPCLSEHWSTSAGMSRQR